VEEKAMIPTSQKMIVPKRSLRRPMARAKTKAIAVVEIFMLSALRFGSDISYIVLHHV